MEDVEKHFVDELEQVCLEDYEADQDCRIMACKHAFHAECIDRWLEVGRNSCPA